MISSGTFVSELVNHAKLLFGTGTANPAAFIGKAAMAHPCAVTVCVVAVPSWNAPLVAHVSGADSVGLRRSRRTPESAALITQRVAQQ